MVGFASGSGLILAIRRDFTSMPKKWSLQIIEERSSLPSEVILAVDSLIVDGGLMVFSSMVGTGLAGNAG